MADPRMRHTPQKLFPASASILFNEISRLLSRTHVETVRSSFGCPGDYISDISPNKTAYKVDPALATPEGAIKKNYKRGHLSEGRPTPTYIPKPHRFPFQLCTYT